MSTDWFETDDRFTHLMNLTTRGKGRRLHLPNLGLRISERRLLLAVGDFILLNGALLSVLLYRATLSAGAPLTTRHWLWFFMLNLLWYPTGVLLELYDLRRAANPLPAALTAGAAALLVTVVYPFIPYITPSFPDRRLHFYLLPLLATPSVALWRYLYATLIVQPVFRRTAIVVGAGQAGRELLGAINHTAGARQDSWSNTVYEVLGFVDDDPHKQRQTLDGIPVLGDGADLLRLVHKLRPDEVILAITASHTIDADLFQAILQCRETGTAVTTMAHLYEELTGRVAVEHAGRNISIVLPVTEFETARFYLLARRAMDLVGASVGCLLMLATIPPIWLANRLFSPGDLFYRQERVGHAGKSFTIFKFRSMVMDAESGCGAVWAQADDPRVTALGRLLRKTRLDELPQFLNVLKGDMSLIGPRPERPAFIEELSSQIPFYRLRHAVKPGITGWAQVQHHYGASVKDSLIKLQYDLYYIKRQSLFLDLIIVIRTLHVILGFKGR